MRVALLVMLSLVLAGCSGGKGSPDEDGVFGDAKVSAGKGLVRGLVVSTALTPVAGANVELVGQALNATTTEQGAFVFNDLAPGPYFVRVTKVGWTDAQHSVEVVADVAEPPIVKVLIERIPGFEPSAQTLKFDGYISCSIGTPINIINCNTIEEQYSRFFIPIESPPTWIQTELLWDSTQAAGDWLYVIHGICTCDGSFPPFANRFDETYDARSPYVVRADPAFLEAVEAGTTNNELFVDVSASGPEPATTNGSGVALNQEFTLYVTFFHNIEPAEGWTFHANGQYPVPST